VAVYGTFFLVGRGANAIPVAMAIPAPLLSFLFLSHTAHNKNSRNI
jgi:hypothetical protein